MKKVILHIGSPKTGTSAIQSCLYKNTEKLYSHGILYPQQGLARPNTHAHHNLAYEYTVDNSMRKKFNDENGNWKSLINELETKKFHTAIISSEAFFRKQPHIINTIANQLNDYEVTIVCYLRRQDIFFESAFNQLEKFGKNTTDFNQFLLSNRPNFNYYKILSNWKSSFGEVIIKDFDKIKKGSSITASFLETLSLDKSIIIEEKTSKPNSRVGSYTLSCLDYTQRQLAEYGIILTQQSRQKIIENLSKEIDSAPLYFKNINEREALMKNYLESNEMASNLTQSKTPLFEQLPSTERKIINSKSTRLPEDDKYIIEFIKRIKKYHHK